MSHAQRLFLKRRYSEALEYAARLVDRSQPDNFGAAVETLGKCLLAVGRYKEAEARLEQLAAQRHFWGARVGSHFAYAGLAHWFQGHFKKAVGFWKAGLKAQYQSQNGMQLPWILYYAAARHPRSISRRDATQIVRCCARRLPRDYNVYRLNQFLLGKRTYEGVRKQLPADYKNPRLAATLITEYRSLLDFFAGVRALLDRDIDRFYGQMLACASISGHDSDSVQLLIAECELRRGPLKWRMRWRRWLQQNVFGG